MKPLRFVKRAALVIALSEVFLLAGISVYFRIEQHRFRREAERLLVDVRELQLKRGTAERVMVVVKEWGFEKWQQPDKPCTDGECIYQLRLMPQPARAHDLSPFTSGLAARVIDWLGMRPSAVQAWVQIRGKALGSISFSVDTLGRGCDGSAARSWVMPAPTGNGPGGARTIRLM